MITTKQIEHDINIKERIKDVIEEMENWSKEMVDPFYVSTRLNSILSRASDARFELRCRQSDRLAELGITNE